MYALFVNIEDYHEVLDKINAHFGFPNGCGTDTYLPISPPKDKNGRYYIKIDAHLAAFFASCTIVDTIELPREVDNEID